MSSDATLQDVMIKQAGIDTIQHAGLVQDLLQIAAMNRRHVDNRVSQQLGIEPMADDEMGDITLGDRNTYVSQPAASPPAAQSALSPWIKLAVGAGLAATGIGAPIGIGLGLQALPEIINAMKPQVIQQPAQQPSQPQVINHSTVESLSVDMTVEPPKDTPK